jgi:hypothetical protein
MARTIAAGGWREKWTNARDKDNSLASDSGARLNDDYMSDIKVVHCKDHYRVYVMVPSCLHTYQLQFGFWTDYYIGFLSVSYLS